MTEVLNLQTLRTLTGSNGEIVYVKGHTNPGDGGEGHFIWKNGWAADDLRFMDNDGTIIRPLNSATAGWFRLIDGRINIKYFGVIGFHETDGDKIQKAIDFAEKNGDFSLPPNGYPYFGYVTNAGTVVYIPSGNYKIKNTLILKNGVSMEGESMEKTVLTADNNAQTDGNMIEMATGHIISINVSNMTFTGDVSSANPDQDNIIKNCMHLKAQLGDSNDGGIWNSTFKNIRINHFNGCGIILEGGGEEGQGYKYNRVNQNLIFENVLIERQKDNANCLLIQGQQGQLTFINCVFDGQINWSNLSGQDPYTTNKLFNVVIEGKTHVQSAIIKFMTCTFQYSEYGVFLKFAENVTFDNCWFEQLDRAIGVTLSSDGRSCKSINILNSRFANASGFGSDFNRVLNKNLYNNNPSGSCVHIEGSGNNVNIHNNYVAVSNIYSEHNYFIKNLGQNSQINASNNSFQILGLSKTYGINYCTINVIGNAITTAGYRFVVVNHSSLNIKEITSLLGAGETITIRANSNYLKFDSTKNILFPIYRSLSNPFKLKENQTATFIKVDNTYENAGVTYNEYWQLLSVTRGTS